jgi:hypothetical protein
MKVPDQMGLIVVAAINGRIYPIQRLMLCGLPNALEPLQSAKEFRRYSHFVLEASFKLARAQANLSGQFAYAHQTSGPLESRNRESHPQFVISRSLGAVEHDLVQRRELSGHWPGFLQLFEAQLQWLREFVE